MPKLSVLGKVKRVAQSKRESESSPSDDELESANLSLEVDPFASVFDVEGDESVSIASVATVAKQVGALLEALCAEG